MQEQQASGRVAPIWLAAGVVAGITSGLVTALVLFFVLGAEERGRHGAPLVLEPEVATTDGADQWLAAATEATRALTEAVERSAVTAPAERRRAALFTGQPSDLLIHWTRPRSTAYTKTSLLASAVY